MITRRAALERGIPWDLPPFARRRADSGVLFTVEGRQNTGL
jgi:hypothetical protein